MVERYISLYSTSGDVLSKVRTELTAPDSKLKARLYQKLSPDKQNNVDLSGVDFTGHTLTNCRGCWFDNATLIGATLINPVGSTFRDADLTGAALVNDCRDLYLLRTRLMGLDVREADGIIIGGYSVKGEPVVANMRTKNWWIATEYQGVQYYCAFDEITAVTYGISDPAFTSRLIEMIGDMRDQMVRMGRSVNEKYSRPGTVTIMGGGAGGYQGGGGGGNAAGISPAAEDTTDFETISRKLRAFTQNQSEDSMRGVPQMRSDNAGDILNQGN